MEVQQVKNSPSETELKKFEGFKNPYKMLISDLQQQRTNQNFETEINNPRSTAKFGTGETNFNLYSAQEVLKQSQKNIIQNKDLEKFDDNNSQEFLDSFSENHGDVSLNQSELKIMMNNPLGLNKSYMNKLLNKSEHDASQYSRRNEISKFNLYDKIQFNFEFNAELGHEQIELRLNNFDEHILSQITDDTQDLSYISIPRFKNNLYEKDNSLYLNMTNLDQSNISFLKEKNLTPHNRTVEKERSRNISNNNTSKTIFDSNKQENMDNILVELELAPQNDKKNSFFEEKKQLAEIRESKENQASEERNIPNKESFEFRQTAYFRENYEEIRKNTQAKIINDGKFLQVLPKNKGQSSSIKKKHLIESNEDEDETENENRENVYQIIENNLNKLSQLDISKISVFEVNQDNEEFIGNITANNVNVLLLAPETKTEITDQDKKNAKFESDLSVEFNQELNRDFILIDHNTQQKILEVSLGKEETQITEELKDNKNSTGLLENKLMNYQSKSFILNKNEILENQILNGNKSFGDTPLKYITIDSKPYENKFSEVQMSKATKEKDAKKLKEKLVNKSLATLASSEEKEKDKYRVHRMNQTYSYSENFNYQDKDENKYLTFETKTVEDVKKIEFENSFQLQIFDSKRSSDQALVETNSKINNTLGLKNKLSEDLRLEVQEFLKQLKESPFNNAQLKNQS